MSGCVGAFLSRQCWLEQLECDNFIRMQKGKHKGGVGTMKGGWGGLHKDLPLAIYPHVTGVLRESLLPLAEEDCACLRRSISGVHFCPTSSNTLWRIYFACFFSRGHLSSSAMCNFLCSSLLKQVLSLCILKLLNILRQMLNVFKQCYLIWNQTEDRVTSVFEGFKYSLASRLILSGCYELCFTASATNTSSERQQGRELIEVKLPEVSYPSEILTIFIFQNAFDIVFHFVEFFLQCIPCIEPWESWYMDF